MEEHDPRNQKMTPYNHKPFKFSLQEDKHEMNLKIVLILIKVWLCATQMYMC